MGHGNVIRRATVADAAGIARVHVETWQTAYRGIVPQAYLDGRSIPRSQRKWVQSLGDPRAAGELVLVSEAAGQIVGFVKAARERSGDPLYLGEVHALYVLREHQGQGVGRGLMTSAAHGLLRRDVRAMLVWVLKENPARRFYERLGGQFLREGPIDIGGAMLTEVAYGWPDLAAVFGSPPSGAVLVSPYDPRWPIAFEAIRSRLSAALNELATRIEHVGGTSVPGLAAKPVIDIDVLLRDPSDLPEAIRRLAVIGYEHEGERGIPTRHAFRSHFDGPKHHLYVCTSADGEFARHVAFRDYLRAHPGDSRAYGDLKRALAERFANDRDAYMEGKHEFVQTLLARALSYRSA